VTLTTELSLAMNWPHPISKDRAIGRFDKNVYVSMPSEVVGNALAALRRAFFCPAARFAAPGPQNRPV